MLRNLENPPQKKTYDYLQADYVELLCLVNEDKILTQGDIKYRYMRDADIDHVSYQDLHDSPELDLDEAEKSDRLARRVEDLLRNLKYRQDAFGDHYPFSVSDSLSDIELKPRLNEHQKLYVYLLMASSLRNFDKRDQIRIGQSFETLSAMALQEYLGENAAIHIFGSRSSGRYSGNISQKIEQLSKDLHERPVYSENMAKTTHTGDGGLDIVCWFETNDSSPGKLIIFGQCACTEKWDEKLHSSGYKKWKHFIELSIEPINAIFIPFCFRDSGGQWYEMHRIQMSLLIDRLRIVSLLQTVESPLSGLPIEMRELIDCTLSFVEEL